MGTTVSRPFWLMIIGFTVIVGVSLLQRLGAAAIGVSPDSDGYKTLLFLWWVIGGIPFIVGLMMWAVGIDKKGKDGD